MSANDPRRLLVISYHFPPDGTIGGQRWAGLTRYLARRGWEIHVITAAQNNGADGPGIQRHVCRRRRTLNDLYRASRTKAVEPAASKSDIPMRASAPSIFTTVKRALGAAMSLPDHGRGWVSGAALMARRLLNEHRFDLVISSGPPHSAHFAAMFATLGGDVPFWIDMRDPWSITHEMNTPEDKFVRGERYVLRRLERLVFPRAARILVNTREFASVLREMEPDSDVVYFPNGIDMQSLPARDLNSVRPVSIAYVGTLYAGRNLSSIFAAIHQIAQERPSDAARVHVDIAGPLESPHREQMQEQIASLGLQSNVSVHGVLPRAAALGLLSRSHLALVLAQEQPMCVPAKIYESVGLGVPTLVLAEENSAAACEARRIGAMTTEPGEVAKVKAIIEDMLAARLPQEIEPAVPISYEALAERLDEMIRRSSQFSRVAQPQLISAS